MTTAVQSTTEGGILSKSVASFLRPTDQQGIDKELVSLSNYLDQLGLEDSRGFLPVERNSSATIQKREAELQSAKAVKAVFPDAQLIDVKALLGVCRADGLPACVAFSIDSPRAQVNFYKEMEVDVNLVNVSKVDALAEPNIYSSEKLLGYRLKEGRFLEKNYKNLSLYDREVDVCSRVYELNPSLRSAYAPLQESIFRLVSGIDAVSAPALEPAWYDFLRKKEQPIEERALASLTKVTLAHDFGNRTLPIAARETIQKASQAKLFSEILMIAEAHAWKVTYSGNMPEGWKPSIPAERVPDKDPLIVGYDGHHHYILDRFDVTNLEAWLEAEFSTRVGS